MCLCVRLTCGLPAPESLTGRGGVNSKHSDLILSQGAQVFQDCWGLCATHHNLVLNQSLFCFHFLEHISRGFSFIHISSKPLDMSRADSCKQSADKHFLRSRWLMGKTHSDISCLILPRDAYHYKLLQCNIKSHNSKTNLNLNVFSQWKCFLIIFFICVCLINITC